MLPFTLTVRPKLCHSVTCVIKHTHAHTHAHTHTHTHTHTKHYLKAQFLPVQQSVRTQQCDYIVYERDYVLFINMSFQSLVGSNS